MSDIFKQKLDQATEALNRGDLNLAENCISQYLYDYDEKTNAFAWNLKAQIYYWRIFEGNGSFTDVYNLYNDVIQNWTLIREKSTDKTIEELITTTALYFYEFCCTALKNNKTSKRNNRVKLFGNIGLGIAGLFLQTDKGKFVNHLGHNMTRNAQHNIHLNIVGNRKIGTSKGFLLDLISNIKNSIPKLLDSQYKAIFFNKTTYLENKYTDVLKY